MRLRIMTVRDTFDIMVHLPREQPDDIGFLIYNLARLQHHSNETANVPKAVPRPVWFGATVEIHWRESSTPSGSALAFMEKVEMVITCESFLERPLPN